MCRPTTSIRQFVHGAFGLCVFIAFVLRTALGQEPTGSPVTSPGKVPGPGLVVKKNIPFHEVDGESIEADLYFPDDSQRRPVVLMIHGGGWVAGDKWNVADHARELAENGFFAMAINYRLSPKHKWPAQIEDCHQALRWLSLNAETYHLDTDRIASWGYSAGAHLALLLAFNNAVKELPGIKACVAGGAPSDLSFIPEESKLLAGFLGASRRENPKVYREASPISFLKPSIPPLFIYHGDRDLLVPVDQSRQLFDRSRNLGAKVDYFEVKEQGHLLSFIDPEARRRSVDFLVATLGNQ